MKKRQLFITLLLLTGILLANPGYGDRRNYHPKSDRSRDDQDRKLIVIKNDDPSFVFSFDPNSYHAYRNNPGQRNYVRRTYRDRRHDDRVYSRSDLRKHCFKGLEPITLRNIKSLTDKLDRYYRRGVIDKKEYHYARRELHNMSGKLYPRNYCKDHLERVIEELKDLGRLRRRGKISSQEYARYKIELLKML